MLGEGRASEVLVPAMAALLARNGVEKSSLSLVAVASGPGSFTGLRVALATAKGLAEAFAIPVVPVSVLEAIALASGVEGRVVAAMDAQRGEVFIGEYMIGKIDKDMLDSAWPAERLREEIARLGDFMSLLASGASQPPVFTPDADLAASLREASIRLREAEIEAAPEVSVISRPTAEDIARIAHCKWIAGFRADVAALDANYLRRSDAEIVFARKPGGVS